jgi:hypothetical protein
VDDAEVVAVLNSLEEEGEGRHYERALEENQSPAAARNMAVKDLDHIRDVNCDPPERRIAVVRLIVI